MNLLIFLCISGAVVGRFPRELVGVGLDRQGVKNLDGLGEVNRRDQLVDLVVPEVV